MILISWHKFLSYIGFFILQASKPQALATSSLRLLTFFNVYTIFVKFVQEKA